MARCHSSRPPGSAVSIALVRRDGHPLVGVVYDISGARVVHAIDGVGVFIDGALIAAGHGADGRFLRRPEPASRS